MKELITKTGSKGASTKDRVLELLFEEFPLTLAELHRRLYQRARLRLSYQAARKALLSLSRAGVVQKDEQGRYQVDKEWLLSTKRTVDSLLNRYSSAEGARGALALASRGETATFLLESLYEADNMWTDILSQCCAAMPTKESKRLVSYSNYAWYMLINLGQETGLFADLKRQGFEIDMRLFRAVPLNRWAARVYKSVGLIAKVVNAPKAEDQLAFNIIGDKIIQIELSTSAVKHMQRIFRRYKTLQQIPESQLAQLAHAQHEIRISLLENAALARGLERSYP